MTHQEPNITASTPIEQFTIGVVVTRKKIKNNPWIDHQWVGKQILEGAADLPDWTLISHTDDQEDYYAGHYDLRLFPHETDTIKDNLESSFPAVYVFLRKAETATGITLAGATVCSGEAHAHVDTGFDQVEALRMPEAIKDWCMRFIVRYHVEGSYFKRRRNDARTN